MSPLRSAVVAAVSAAAVLLPAAPVVAEQYTQVDAVRDVTRITLDEEGDPTSADAPGESDTDIRTVRFDLGERRLLIVATMRSIGPRVRLFAAVRTPRARFDVMTTPRGRVRVFGGASDGGRARKAAACAGAHLVTRPATRTHRIVVPVSCLGTPRSARLGFAVGRYRLSESESEFSVDIDDAARRGYPDPDADIRLGQRIRRG